VSAAPGENGAPIEFYVSIGSMYTFLTVMRLVRVEDLTGIPKLEPIE
jgi:hypothetical protein